MFGANDQNQYDNDDPAMLDSVNDLAGQPAAQVEPPQVAASAPITMPAVGTPTPSVGFSMPSSTPPVVDTPVSEDTAAESATDNPGLAMAANPAHAEPAAGFSNAADFNAANQPAPTEPTIPDNTIPQTSSFTSVDTSPSMPETDTTTQVASEPPQIIGHPSQSIQMSTQQDAAPAVEAPQQNDVTPPPHLDTVDTNQSQQDIATAEVNHEQLASIKQEALGHLEVLSDHLEGDPEVVFTTTMQMIQANDNHTLIQKAFEAAKEIKDDKVRAQAMQDIINEVNYFSPPQAQDGQ